MAWYEHAISTYFDEVHTIHAVRITPAPDAAKVELVLQWQPVVWQAPAATSTQLNFFAAHTWELKRSPTTQQLWLVTYNVDYFIPVAGSPVAVGGGLHGFTAASARSGLRLNSAMMLYDL